MANVDDKLHTDADELDLAPESVKRGIFGAAGGSYVGPINAKSAIEGPTSPTHPTGDEDSATARGAGGAEDSSGYRTSDTYGVDGANSGGTGGADTSVSGPVRAARSAAQFDGTVQPTYYRGAGAAFVQVAEIDGAPNASDSFKFTYKGDDSVTFVAGGSGATDMVASAMQTDLRTLCADPFLTVTGSDDFASDYIITFSKPPGGGLSVTQVVNVAARTITITVPKGSHRNTQKGDGGFALGQSGRGTNVDGSTVDLSAGNTGTAIARPTIQEADNPAAGVVTVGDGTGVIEVDLHADDVTAYAGVELLIYARGDKDTNEDGAFVAKTALHDSDTKANANSDTSGTDLALAAGTYAVYARFVAADGNVGPLSPRGTVVVS